MFQALDDIGFTIPAQGSTYWNAEAMKPVDYQDLEKTPEAVASTTATLARNAAHLARLLRDHHYPAPLSGALNRRAAGGVTAGGRLVPHQPAGISASRGSPRRPPR